MADDKKTYTQKIHENLVHAYGDATPSLEDFSKKMQDKEYRKKIHENLVHAYGDATPDENTFYQKLDSDNVKKKGSSELSGKESSTVGGTAGSMEKQSPSPLPTNSVSNSGTQGQDTPTNPPLAAARNDEAIQFGIALSQYETEEQKAARAEGITVRDWRERQISLGNQLDFNKKIESNTTIQNRKNELFAQAQEQANGRTPQEVEHISNVLNQKITADPVITAELTKLQTEQEKAYNKQLTEMNEEYYGVKDLKELESAIDELDKSIEEVSANTPVKGNTYLQSLIDKREDLISNHAEKKVQVNDRILSDKYDYVVNGKKVKYSEAIDYILSNEFEDVLDDSKSAWELGSSAGDAIKTNDPKLQELIKSQEKVKGEDWKLRGLTSTSWEILRSTGNIPFFAKEAYDRAMAAAYDAVGQDGQAAVLRSTANLAKVHQLQDFDWANSVSKALSNDYKRDYNAITLLKEGEVFEASKEALKMSLESLPYMALAAAGTPFGVAGEILAVALPTATQSRKEYAKENKFGGDDDAQVLGSLGKGLLEGGTNAISLGIFTNQLKQIAKNTAKVTAGAAAAGATAAAVNGFKKELGRQTLDYANNLLKELPGEFVAGFGGSAIDDLVNDREINVAKATEEGALGMVAAMTTVSVPQGIVLGSSVYNNATLRKEYKANKDVLSTLFNERVKANPNNVQAIDKAIKSTIDDSVELAKQAKSLAEKALPEEKNVLIDIQKKINELEDTKSVAKDEETVKILEEKQKILESTKDDILKEIESREVAVEETTAQQKERELNEKEQAQQDELVAAVDELGDDETKVFHFESLDAVPEELRERAVELEGEVTVSGKGIKGLFNSLLGRGEKKTVKQGFRVTVSGKELRDIVQIEQEAESEVKYTPEQLSKGREEIDSVKVGKVSTTNPVKIYKGIGGKVDLHGQRINAHEGAKGVFSAVDEELAKQYGKEFGVAEVEIPEGTTIEVVEVDMKGLSPKQYREAEVEAINNSDAQIVKLITLDGYIKGGQETNKQSQYVIKDEKLFPEREKVYGEEKVEVKKEPKQAPKKSPPVRKEPVQRKGATKKANKDKADKIPSQKSEKNGTSEPTVKGAKAKVEKAENVKDLQKINEEIWGLSKEEALATAAAQDVMIGTMAARAGITKAEMYDRIGYVKGAEGLPKGVKFQVDAYHGSPYQFDKFTTEKIGTGEGAQAFGWGLYFTDLESIGRAYAKKLSGDEYSYDGTLISKDAYEYLDVVDDSYGENFNEETIKGLAEKAIAKINNEYIPDLKEIQQTSSSQKQREEIPSQINRLENVIDELNNIIGSKEIKKAINKNLYKVSLHKGKTPDQYTWLEWDKPVSDDFNKKITEQARKEGILTEREGKSDVISKVQTGAHFITNEGDGAVVYDSLTKAFGSDKEASLFLLRAGIDGIKYPAESISRGATSDTARGFNYVVFDENAVSIEEVIKFQKDAVKSHGAMMMDLDGKATLFALTDPNVSTPLHELAHVYEHYLTNAERKQILDWAGHKKWTTETSEKFARGFEKYLQEGKAPTKELQSVFEKFKKWLTDIYKGVATLDGVKLNKPMRDIYNAMFEEETTQVKAEKGVTSKVDTVLNQANEEAEKVKLDYNEKGQHLAPNGKPSNLTEEQAKIVRTKAFKNWFGDWENDPENASKVVDENGEPLVVYHGSPYAGITEFDKSKSARVSSGLKEFGTYFSTNKKLAEFYKEKTTLSGEAASNIEKELFKLRELQKETRNNREYYEYEERIEELKRFKEGKVYPVFLNLRTIKEFDAKRKENVEAWNELSVKASYKTATNRDAMEFLRDGLFKVDKVDGIRANNIVDAFVQGDEKLTKELIGDAFLVFDSTDNAIKLADGSNVLFGDTNDIRFQETSKNLTPAEQFKQGFEEYVDSTKRKFKEKIAKINEAHNEKIQKLKDNHAKANEKQNAIRQSLKDAYAKKAAQEKEKRELLKEQKAEFIDAVKEYLKDYKDNKFLPKEIVAAMKAINEATTPATFRKAKETIVKAITNSTERAWIADAKKLIESATTLYKKVGADKETLDKVAELIAISPDLIPKSMREKYVALLTNIKGIPDEGVTLRAKADEILEAVQLEMDTLPALKEMYDLYAEENPENSYSENLDGLLKEGLITPEDYELMKKYKKEILPPKEKVKEEEDSFDEEEAKADILETTKGIKPREYKGAKRGQETLRFLSELTEEQLEGLSPDSLKLIDKAVKLAANGYAAHVAEIARTKVEASLAAKETKLDDTKTWGLSMYARNVFEKIKGLTQTVKHHETLEEAIASMPRYAIDQVVGNFKNSTIYKNSFRDLGLGVADNLTFESMVENELSAAERKLKGNANARAKSMIKVYLLMLQRQHESNPNNPRAHSAKDLVEATIKESDYSEDSKKVIKELFDKYSTNGELDLKKITDALTKEEKGLLTALDNVIKETTPMSEYTESVIRGTKYEKFNNYVPYNVFRGDKKSMKQQDEELAKKFNNPNTRAGVGKARVNTAQPVLFDPITAVRRSALQTSLDYHVTPALRQARANVKAMSLASKTQEGKDIAKAIDNNITHLINHLTPSYFAEDSVFADVEKFFIKKSYQAQLASPDRALNDTLSNISHALIFDHEAFGEGVGVWWDLFKEDGLTAAAINKLDTTHKARLVASLQMDSKNVEKSFFEKSKVGGRMTDVPKDNIFANIWSGTKDVFKVTNEWSDEVASKAVALPDKAVGTVFFLGQLNIEFKKITGKDLDFRKLAKDPDYAYDNEKALKKAAYKADRMLQQSIGSTNPAETIAKNQKDKSKHPLSNILSDASKFMTTFRFSEFASAVKATHDAFLKGELTNTEARRLLAATVARMIIYDQMRGAILNGTLQLLAPNWLDDEDEERFSKESIFGSFLGSIVTLALNRNLNNYASAMVNYVIEEFNEAYGEGVTRKGEYNKYENAFTYSTFYVPETDKDVYKLMVANSGVYKAPFSAAFSIGKFGAELLKQPKGREGYKAKQSREERKLQAGLQAAVSASVLLLPLGAPKLVKDVSNKIIYKDQIEKRKEEAKAKEEAKKSEGTSSTTSSGRAKRRTITRDRSERKGVSRR